MNSRNVGGYHFSCDEDAKMAKEELQRIKTISEKLGHSNPQSILLVYNKSIQSNIFTTPVGIKFLKEMQDYLYQCETIDKSEILDIPVRISYADAIELRSNNRYKNIDNQKKIDFAKRFRWSLFGNLVLIIMVIAMFVITMTADNPNILNYETAIVNKYSEWEQSLLEKENELKERESQLNNN